MRRDADDVESLPMNRHRTLIVSALLASLGPLVGNGLYAGPVDSGEAVLSAHRDGLPMIGYVAYALELLGLTALAVLFAWLVVFLLERAPVAAAATGIAGSAMIAVKLASAAPMMTLHSVPDTLDPATAEALMSLNDQSFVIAGFLMSLAFLAAGLGLLTSNFPSWLAWWATVAGGLGVLAGGVGVTRPEAYVPIPFLLLLVWMIAVALSTVMRPDGPASTVREKQTSAGLAASE